MEFTTEVRDKIIQKLNEQQLYPSCPRCAPRSSTWTLVDGYVALPIQKNFRSFNTFGQTLPCIALVCNNCGNTQLINLISIGLRELIEEKTWDPQLRIS